MKPAYDNFGSMSGVKFVASKFDLLPQQPRLDAQDSPRESPYYEEKTSKDASRIIWCHPPNQRFPAAFILSIGGTILSLIAIHYLDDKRRVLRPALAIGGGLLYVSGLLLLWVTLFTWSWSWWL
jgi:hypothetical protein